MLKSHKDLVVWQKGMALVQEIYGLTAKLPKDEAYGLAAQMRRAAISIPSNIAEGNTRGRKEFAQFLRIAHGSAAELETQILLMRNLYPYIQLGRSENLVIEIQKMLSVMVRKLTPNP